MGATGEARAMEPRSLPVVLRLPLQHGGGLNSVRIGMKRHQLAGLKRSFALTIVGLTLVGCHAIADSASATPPGASGTPATITPAASPTPIIPPSIRATASPNNTYRHDRA